MKSIQTEVLICGGGCAGIAAALASARNGAKTLLIERAGFSGGIITWVGLPYFDGLVDFKTGRFVAKGIGLGVMAAAGTAKHESQSINDCPPDGVTKRWMSVMIPSTEEFKIIADAK